MPPGNLNDSECPGGGPINQPPRSTSSSRSQSKGTLHEKFRTTIHGAAKGDVHKATFTRVRYIGSGSFGQIDKFHMDLIGENYKSVVVIKSPYIKKRDKAELTFLRQLKGHPNIVSLQYFFRHHGKTNLVLEFIAGRG